MIDTEGEARGGLPLGEAERLALKWLKDEDPETVRMFAACLARGKKGNDKPPGVDDPGVDDPSLEVQRARLGEFRAAAAELARVVGTLAPRDIQNLALGGQNGSSLPLLRLIDDAAAVAGVAARARVLDSSHIPRIPAFRAYVAWAVLWFRAHFGKRPTTSERSPFVQLLSEAAAIVNSDWATRDVRAATRWALTKRAPGTAVDADARGIVSIVSVLEGRQAIAGLLRGAWESDAMKEHLEWLANNRRDVSADDLHLWEAIQEAGNTDP